MSVPDCCDVDAILLTQNVSREVQLANYKEKNRDLKLQYECTGFFRCERILIFTKSFIWNSTSKFLRKESRKISKTKKGGGGGGGGAAAAATYS